VNLDPRTGHEQSGFRPAIVLSNTIYNERSSTAVICPITSKLDDWPFKVALPDGLAVTGAVLVDQIRAVDWRTRGARFACVCPGEILDEIDATLDVLFRGVSRPYP